MRYFGGSRPTMRHHSRVSLGPLGSSRLGWFETRRRRLSQIRKERGMSGVRLLVGTRKGRVRPNRRRETEQVGHQRSTFRGLGDLPPQGIARRSRSALRVAVERLVRTSHPAFQRRRKTWETMGNEFRYEGVPGTHQWYDGTQHPWEFKRVWHLEPSLTDPDTVYAGVEDAALFKSADGGRTWEELAGLRGHASGPVAAGRRRHVPAHDPARPRQSESDLCRHLGRRRVPER